MKHGSLFSGIGGFDLAAEWMGWENIFHCEWNPFGQKVLKHYWPNAISYSDITKTDFSIHRGEIDIITGGFPCQPYSQAGKRKGKEDERHLWPFMLRAIREVQPGWIVGENVPGLANWEGGMVLKEIKTDLEGEGFEMFPPVIIPACAKDADHRRDRIWIIAHNNKRTEGSPGACAGSFKDRRKNNDEPQEWGEQTEQRSRCINVLQSIANPELRRRKKRRWQTASGISNNSFQSGGFQVEPLLRRGDDGLSNWMDRIKGLGNAVVPQVVFEIFKAIEKTECPHNQT